MLKRLGANYIGNVAYKDTWCLVLHKGDGVVAEAVTTYFAEVKPRSTNLEVSPLTLQLAVLPTPGESSVSSMSHFPYRVDRNYANMHVTLVLPMLNVLNVTIMIQ